MTISSVPAYIFGLVLIYFLAFRAALFPMMGGVTLGVVHANSFDYFTDVLRHAALPVITVLLVSLGGWALGMRGMMITVQGEDYMILAEAKGLKPQRIFMRYAVRNALLPLVTGLGIAMGHLVTGQILVESLFGFPGMGSLLSGSIRLNDYNIIYGITFLIILSIGVMTFLLDLAYPFIDPRIRLGGGGR
jgi:peptide/nickel transport system permease protein